MIIKHITAYLTRSSRSKLLVALLLISFVTTLSGQIIVGPGSGGSGGGPVTIEWGDITGTLSDQTDLQTALDDKRTISTMGAGVNTWLTTPSSANLASAVTGETGSGALVFANSPTISGWTWVSATSGMSATSSAGTGSSLFSFDPGVSSTTIRFKRSDAGTTLQLGDLSDNDQGLIRFRPDTSPVSFSVFLTDTNDRIPGLFFVEAADDTVPQVRLFANDATTSRGFTIFRNGNGLFDGPVFDFASTGVRFSATDGVLTLLGLGNGNDENLSIDFDNAAANTVAVASSTGVNSVNFGTIAVRAPNLTAQKVTCNFTESATGTTLMPVDDTIPQNDEGDEYMTCSITPTNASSKLFVNVSTMFGVSASGKYVGVALFRDTTADAIAVRSITSSSTNPTFTVSFETEVSAVAASATTFKVRIGPNSAATITFNGANNARIYGAIPTSTMTITEVLP